MRFDRDYTAAPQCAPRAFSIFAGRSPVGLRVTRFAQPPRGDVRLFTGVEKDPFELNNLTGFNPVKTELTPKLESWMIREHDDLPLSMPCRTKVGR